MIDGLSTELTKRASRLFRHALLAHVDGAIRGSNAKYDDPRVLERIDVKILHGSPGDDGTSFVCWTHCSRSFDRPFVHSLLLILFFFSVVFFLFQSRFPCCSGWKVFTLDYSVANTPLSAIITNKAMANYLQIFRFLWRIKRVESSLSSLWQRTMNTRGLLRRDVPELFGIMHKCSLLRNEMQHVTTILLSYMMYVNYFVPLFTINYLLVNRVLVHTDVY